DLAGLGPSSSPGLPTTSRTSRTRRRCRVRAHPAPDGLCRLGMGHHGLRALDMLKRFGSVTVLNGHIHQIVQKVEGNMTFHTARPTCFARRVLGPGLGPGPCRCWPTSFAPCLALPAPQCGWAKSLSP